MKPLLFFLPICAAAGATMLSQAEEASAMYAQEIAKTAPPARFPLAENCLNLSSVWFSADLAQLASDEAEGALDVFCREDIWSALKEIGFDGLRLEGLREPGTLSIDPKWGGEWTKAAAMAQKQSIALIGELVGNAVAPGADFEEALQNVGDYPNLFHLVEIDPKDWKLLPPVPSNGYETNIPWLTIQELHKKGYVPEKYSRWTKTSAWNATTKIRCADGKV